MGETKKKYKNKTKKKHTSFSPSLPQDDKCTAKVSTPPSDPHILNPSSSARPFRCWVNTAALHIPDNLARGQPKGQFSNHTSSRQGPLRTSNKRTTSPPPLQPSTSAKSHSTVIDTLAGQQKGQRSPRDQAPNNDATASLLTGKPAMMASTTNCTARRPRQARKGLLHSGKKIDRRTPR